MSDTRENDKLRLCSPFDLVSYEKEENYKKEIKRLQKQLSEIKDAYIDLTTQDEYGSYYIEEAKDFVDTVGRILKEAGLLQDLNK